MTHKFQSWDSVALETMSDLISRKVVTGERAGSAGVFEEGRRGAGRPWCAAERYAKARQPSKHLKRVFSP
jgi:hypothetical protein